MSIGLFIGRFQPFHNGHFHVIEEALKEVDILIIGIGSSNESNTEKNPYSAELRRKMIIAVLKANNISRYQLIEIPDFHNDEKWRTFIEENVSKFDTVYLSNKNTSGEQAVERCLNDYPLKKIPTKEGIQSSLIREKMKNNEPWHDMVPKEILAFLGNQ